jgi:hypothetical protein
MFQKRLKGPGNHILDSFLKPCALGLFLGLVPLWSEAATSATTLPAEASDLPPDVAMNRDAGREMWLFVNLRVDGQELPFFVDTGTTRTLLDESLEPVLGKRLGTGEVRHFEATLQLARYAAPQLYLGNTPLTTAQDIYTCDLKHLSLLAGRPVMGILGMDCLKHYCVQLDFQAGKIHFLNPEQTDVAKESKTFPLMFYQDCPFIQHAGVTGGTVAKSLIDTGCTEDAMVESLPGAGNGSDSVELPECLWDGEIHTNLCVSLNDSLPLGKHSNSLGLRFLARHLVTLNFPKHELYLRQTSVGPLVDEDLAAAVAFLHNLKTEGRQPGWSKDDCGDFSWPESAANSYTFRIMKKGDSSTYHYIVTRTSKSDPWKLQKAWRTDQRGNKIEEYLLSGTGLVL